MTDKGKTHHIAEILDDSGEVVGYAVFLGSEQVSGVMSLEEAEKFLAQLEDAEPSPPSPSPGI